MTGQANKYTEDISSQGSSQSLISLHIRPCNTPSIDSDINNHNHLFSWGPNIYTIAYFDNG